MLIMQAGVPAFAQIDFSGEYNTRHHEDGIERGAGPDLGNYLGLPISDDARKRGYSWSASSMTQPEWQCRPHGAGQVWRDPSLLRIWKEVDPSTRAIKAFHLEWQFWSFKGSSSGAADTPVYLDGRPHPPDDAPHTWGGFATGHWEGDMLVVKITHLKENFVRRNGLFYSDLATMDEYWVRHDNYLSVILILTDPVYLTEPLIRSSEYMLNLNLQLTPYPCTIGDEIERPDGVVPHYFPDENPDLAEFRNKHPEIPAGAFDGGAETMYPEYRLKFKK